MLLKDYKPRSKLAVKSTLVERPRFPVVDAHNHLGQDFGGGWIDRPIGELLDRLDQAGVTHYVDLDGGWGESVLLAHLEHLKAPAPERFLVFGGVDWERWGEMGDGFPDWAAGRLRLQAKWGTQGLKIWKPFGLTVKDGQGQRVAVDDTRLDPIWQAAAEEKLPVVIHVGDPAAFFDPMDEHNERWEELSAFPDWQFPCPPFPPFQQIMGELANLVYRHPATTFIGAHVGCYAENLGWVSSLLETAPNFYVDISARIGELGRQPYSARRFFEKFSDRILFGTDAGPSLDHYRMYYRFLETDNEYFNYTPNHEIPSQGRWQIYGLHLPENILRKIYQENAHQILGIGNAKSPLKKDPYLLENRKIG